MSLHRDPAIISPLLVIDLETRQSVLTGSCGGSGSGVGSGAGSGIGSGSGSGIGSGVGSGVGSGSGSGVGSGVGVGVGSGVGSGSGSGVGSGLGFSSAPVICTEKSVVADSVPSEAEMRKRSRAVVPSLRASMAVKSGV